MLAYDEVQKEILKAIEKYNEKYKEAESKKIDLHSSLKQIEILGLEVTSFQNEMFAEIQKIQNSETDGSEIQNRVLTLLQEGLQSVVKYISDKPTVLMFDINREEKLMESFSFASDVNYKSLEALREIDKANQSIEENLLKETKNQKPQKGRPVAIRKTRKAKKRISSKDEIKNEPVQDDK